MHACGLVKFKVIITKHFAKRKFNKRKTKTKPNAVAKPNEVGGRHLILIYFTSEIAGHTSCKIVTVVTVVMGGLYKGASIAAPK